MSKRVWGTIISSAIIIGAGAGGVFWVHQQTTNELAISLNWLLFPLNRRINPKRKQRPVLRIRRRASKLLKIARKK